MKESLKVATQPAIQSEPAWLNRNVVGMGLTSLLSDAGHEMATAILPGFLAVLGMSAAALGLIEGVADAVSSFVKIGAGWLADRFGHRKAIAVGGYLLTGVSKALFAFAYGLPLILVGRVLAWFGRGIRGPVRDAMLAESVPVEARGRAFGFHRAGDTLGAVVGPLIGVGLLAILGHSVVDTSRPFRIVFLVTLIPGVGSALAFALMVRDPHQGGSVREFWLTVKNLPGNFRRFLYGVGVFGMGDFSHTLMILAATQLLSTKYGVVKAAEIAGFLYALHNAFYAAASYPVGALSDRFSRVRLLTGGYGIGALMVLGFLVAFAKQITTPLFLALLFALGGIYMAVQDTLEGALTADLVPKPSRGTAFGVMGTVNGVGDLVASVMLGSLWTAVSPVFAFACSSVLMVVGGGLLLSMSRGPIGQAPKSA
jgi:MFS family permease